MLFRDVLTCKTQPNKRLDITKHVQKIIQKYRVQDGLCNIFLKATTAGIMLNEDDKMLMADMEKHFEALAPKDKIYHHSENAHSHIRSAMLNQSITIPIANGQLLMGSWQNIILWEFDVKERERIVVVTMIA